MKIIEAYLELLAKNPERMESIGLWTITTFFVWFVMFIYRSDLVEGAKGANKLFEGNETLLMILYLIVPPSLNYVIFFKAEIPLFAQLFLSIAIAYCLMGRWIFEWILAFRAGATKVDDSSSADNSVSK